MFKRHEGKPIKVYVSGPFSHGDEAKNVEIAVDRGEELLQLGFIPYVPHLNEVWSKYHPHTWDEWLEFDKFWVSQCDALIRIPGISPGGDVEVNYAITLGIPVFYETEDLLNYFGGDNSNT